MAQVISALCVESSAAAGGRDRVREGRWGEVGRGGGGLAARIGGSADRLRGAGDL